MSLALRLGVIMLCHDELHLAARMARLWAQGGAAVAIHIDARAPQAAVGEMHEALAELPDVVLSRRRPCQWGMFSMVQATQDAASILLDRFEDVTHVLLVSGACLPLRPVADMLAYLARHPQRDFIESVTATDVGWAMGGLNEERFSLYFPLSYRERRKSFDHLVRLQQRLGVRRPAPQGVVPHLGSQWWCLTRETLESVLNDPRRPEFDRYFRTTWIPDESYFQTIVRRHSDHIESRSLTLSKFDGQGKPYVFYDDHLQMLQDSGCFIARKIWPLAQGLYDHFPYAQVGGPSAAEPKPARIGRLINQAVGRRELGRPGLYMQSRFPRRDCENGKTSHPYGVFYGFADLFPDFEDWLSKRVDADVHGHLLAADTVEFRGRGTVGPGALSASPALRDLDQRGFLANLIRVTSRMQVIQTSARDQHDLGWFMATDPNARIFVVTGAWAVPLLVSGMPFDDIRRVAANLQRQELAFMDILQSVWTKARVHIWDLGACIVNQTEVLETVMRELGTAPAMSLIPPSMRDLSGIAEFLQKLRNAGLRPRKMGDVAAIAWQDKVDTP